NREDPIALLAGIFHTSVHQGVARCTPGVDGTVERAYLRLEVSVVARSDCSSVWQIHGVLHGRAGVPLGNIRRLTVRQDTASSSVRRGEVSSADGRREQQRVERAELTFKLESLDLAGRIDVARSRNEGQARRAPFGVWHTPGYHAAIRILETFETADRYDAL